MLKSCVNESHFGVPQAVEFVKASLAALMEVTP